MRVTLKMEAKSSSETSKHSSTTYGTNPRDTMNWSKIVVKNWKRIPDPMIFQTRNTFNLLCCILCHGLSFDARSSPLQCHARAILRYKKNPKAARCVSTKALILLPFCHKKKWQNWKQLMMAKYSNYWNVKTSGVEHKALWARTSTEPPCSMHGMNNTLTISPARPKHRWWDNNKWLLKLHNVNWVTQQSSSYVRKVNGKPTEVTRRVCW